MDAEIERITVRRLQTMLDAGLISYKELQPWAESLLMSMERPPRWLCDVAIKTYSPDVSKSLAEFVWSPQFWSDQPEAVERADVDDEHLSSLYLRFERRDVSWATFLELAGQYADNAQGIWNCSEFFKFWNDLEDADFALAVEQKQQEEISSKLRAPIGRIRALHESLKARRRLSR